MKSARVNICGALLLVAGVVCTPTLATAVSHTVNPGESIQAAVDAAAAGDVVRVMPGDYIETHGGTAAVRITKPIKLIAKTKFPFAKVRILVGTGNLHGIVVEPENPGTDPDVDGVMIKGFTVEGFPKNGIWLRHVQNFKIVKNESVENLENGIFPTLSANGLVKKNLAYGSEDAALWVEASENVRVIHNDIHHSPTGLEITVSKNIVAKNNNIHHNTVGVGLYHPNGASLDPLGGDGDWQIINNHIHDNNEPNTAPPGSLSSALPPGAGILVLGVDRVTIRGNKIENNDFLGIAVLDWCVATVLAGPGSGFDCGSNPPVVEPAPNDNQIIGNELISNGGNPPPGFEFAAAEYVFLLGAQATNNCMSRNTPIPPATLFGTPLPPC